MNYNIFLKSEIVNNTNITNSGLLTYVTLRNICQETVPEYFVGISQLCYIATGNLTYNKSLAEFLKAGIKNLSDEKLITIVNQVKSNEYAINLEPLRFDSKNSHYRTISINELHTIMGEKTGHSRTNILRLFLTIVDSFIVGNKGYVMYQGKSISGVYTARTIEFLSKKSGLSESAIIDYIKFLEKHELIYVYRSADIITYEDGAMISIPNVYGRYKYKMQIIEKGSEYEQNYGTSANAIRKKQNRSKTNEKRSLLAKYNSFIKGVNYPEDVLKEIYEFILVYNEDNAGTPDRVRDLTVFEEYNFYRVPEQIGVNE